MPYAHILNDRAGIIKMKTAVKGIGIDNNTHTAEYDGAE